MTRSSDKQTTARPTLKLIAERSGLAITTVSKALRGQGNLNADTVKRVQAIAEEIGYSPNRAGVRLRTGQSSVIAVAIDHADDISDFERRIVDGISAALHKSSYELTLLPIFPETDQCTLFERLVTNRQADGIIFNNTTPDDPRVTLLTELDFPFVTHGRTSLPVPHPFYDFDNECFTYLAAKRLIDKGAHTIGLALAAEGLTYFGHAEAGLARAAKEAGVKVQHLLVKAGDRSFAQTLHDLITHSDRCDAIPEGIVSCSDIGTLALIDACETLGRSVGKDIHIVSRRTSSLLDFCRPRVDTVTEDLSDAGERLAQLLLRRLSGEAATNLQVIAAPLPSWST